MAVVRSFNSYDVFLNFRGEDTRKTFAHKLYVALVQGGLSTFRDEDMMDKGENLKSELEKAIRQSKSSIVVISKDYASSTWCLDELVLILERRRTYRHVVLPVFYDVDPSHVRKQSGRIAEAFARYEEKIKAETDPIRKIELMKKIKGWRSALTEVGYLNGLDLQNHVDGHESKFIKKIIKIIGDKLIQSTVVLKIRLHCEECISKINRIVSKINGVEKFILDPRKDLVTVVGRVNSKELVLCLEEKLKRSVYVISTAKKDDKDGENKEKEGDKSGHKKDKDSVEDKKEAESGGGGGKKENKMEYYGYNPSTYTIPVYHQSEKKGKESGGGGGKKENKLEYSEYNPNTNTNTNTKPVYHQSDKKEKESGDVGDEKDNEIEYHWYNHNTYTMPVYHQSRKKEKECGSRGGKKENKLKYSDYNPNTYTMPVYHQSHKKEKESGDRGGKKENKLEYSGHNPNRYTMPVYHQSHKKEKESGGRSVKKENKMEYHEYYPNTYTMPMYHQSYAVRDYTGTSHHYRQDYFAMFSDDNPYACSMM